MKKFAIAIMLLLPLCAFAQVPQLKDEKAQKELREALDKEVERMTDNLALEIWQEFYVDSIFTHNYTMRYLELQDLNDRKVSNSDAYTAVSDKWMEANYQAMKKILDEEQWAKYEKLGAGRDKRARDKRAEKSSKSKN